MAYKVLSRRVVFELGRRHVVILALAPLAVADQQGFAAQSPALSLLLPASGAYAVVVAVLSDREVQELTRGPRRKAPIWGRWGRKAVNAGLDRAPGRVRQGLIADLVAAYNDPGLREATFSRRRTRDSRRRMPGA